MMWDPISKLYRSTLNFLPAQTATQIQFYREHRHFANLRKPKTFSEKIQYRKLHANNSNFNNLCDKVCAKQYVANIIGSSYTIPTVWFGLALPLERPKEWPTSFVVKSNHTSGHNIFVRGPDVFWADIKREADTWPQSVWPKYLCENWYNKIERQILVEDFISCECDFPVDYKFFVFHGNVEYIQVDTGRFCHHRRSFFNRNWEKQIFTLKFEDDQNYIEKPKHFLEMRKIAEELGKEFDFVRIDLYDTDSTPLFGEFTFAPGCGFERFSPYSYDKKLGDLW